MISANQCISSVLWNLVKTLYLQGPHPLRPCISRHCCKYFCYFTFIIEKCIQGIVWQVCYQIRLMISANRSITISCNFLHLFSIVHQGGTSANAQTRPSELVGPEIRQSTISYAGSLVCWDKSLIDQASDVPSIVSYRFRALKILYFYCCKIMKK